MAFGTDNLLAVKTPDGIRWVAPEEGVKLVEAGQAAWAEEEDVRRNYFRDDPATAAVLGAARGASVGLSDVGLSRVAGVDPSTLKEYKEENPWASGLGEVAGIAGSMLLPGGGLVGQVARGGRAVAGAARGVPVVGKLAAAATEGAALGGAYGASEAAWNPDKGAKDILEQAAWGGAIGVGIGAVGLGVGSLAKFVGRRMKGNLGADADELAQRSLKEQELRGASADLDRVKKEILAIDEELVPAGAVPKRSAVEIEVDLKNLEKQRQKLAYEFDRYKFRRDAIYKRAEKGEAVDNEIEQLATWQRKADQEFRQLDKVQQRFKDELDTAKAFERRAKLGSDPDQLGQIQAHRARLLGERDALESRVAELAGTAAPGKSGWAEKISRSTIARIVAKSVGTAVGGLTGGPIGAAAGWVVAPKVAGAVMDAVGGRSLGRLGSTAFQATKRTGAAIGKIGRPLKPALVTMTAREFTDLRDELEATDTGQLEAEMHLSFPHDVDPAIKQKIIDQSMGRVQLIKAKVAEVSGPPETLGKRRPPPQDKLDELASFIQAVIDPQSVPEAFAEGMGKGRAISKVAVETASQLDPDMLMPMRRVVASQLWRREHNSVKQERNIATFLGQPEIKSRLFQPHTAMGIANLMGSQPPPPKRAGRPSKLSQQHQTALEGALDKVG